MKNKHSTNRFGLLPEFNLNSATNIVAWNKMRIFLERYDIKWDRERQLAVVWMLVAWVGVAFYQVCSNLCRPFT
eukprot:COSAG01_NODE_60_length_29981_cov_23.262533_2_plen_74_part_00